MNRNTINERSRDERLKRYAEWRIRNKMETKGTGGEKLNQTYSCAVCDERAERRQQVVAWTVRCVGATASAAFHVALTVGVVLALTEGVIF